MLSRIAREIVRLKWRFSLIYFVIDAPTFAKNQLDGARMQDIDVTEVPFFQFFASPDKNDILIGLKQGYGGGSRGGLPGQPPRIYGSDSYQWSTVNFRLNELGYNEIPWIKKQWRGPVISL